jgi:adenylate cyclase
MVDARAGFFFLKDEKTNRFELVERINLTAAEIAPLDEREFRNRLRPIMKGRSCACIGVDDLPANFPGTELLITPVGTSGFIGVVDKESRQGLQPFSDGDGRLLQVMGQQAGLALANAAIYRRMADERTLNLNIFNSVANGVISTDLHGTIVRVNPAVKRIFGEEGVFFGRSTVRLFEQNGCSRLAGATAQCLEDGRERAVQDEAVSGRHITLNGRISPLRNETDQIEGLVITLEDLTEQTRLQTMFKQYASDQVVDLLLRDDAAPALGGEMLTATMLFADVVGSMELLRRIGAEEMVSLMNECYTRMVDIVFGHNGTLDKYTGDGFLAVYGAPLSLERDSERAVQTGLDVIEEMARFSQSRGLELGISLGVSRGQVVAGNIGSPRRMEYSVIGPDVNLAARLCDRARSGELLISSRVFEEVRDDFECEHRGRHAFKGLRDPIELHAVLGPKGAVRAAAVETQESAKETVLIDLSVPMVADMEITVSRTAEAVGEFMGMASTRTRKSSSLSSRPASMPSSIPRAKTGDCKSTLP